MGNETTARKKTIFQLDTPLSDIPWPEVSQEDQELILELLCNFLRPIGKYRRVHVRTSKGKKASKRAKKAESEPQHQVYDAEMLDLGTPAPPDILHCIDVGFNSINRSLSAMARQRQGSDDPLGDNVGSERTPLSMVFVARGDQSAAFNCHFPKLVGVASRNESPKEKTRLVGFSKSCSERLSHCLDVARVSSVAIHKDAPGSKALWEVVCKVVEPVDMSWLYPASPPSYQATKINAVQTTVGSKREKKNSTPLKQG